MKIEGSVVLVTGANRGIGAEYVRQLLDRGASKVYAAPRNIESVTNDKAVAISLDVTSASDIAAAVKACSDVTMLINNAGILRETSVMADNALENAKAEFETNVWGPMNLSKSFAPILAANGGGIDAVSAVFGSLLMTSP